MKSPAALGGAFLSEEREGSAVRIKNKKPICPVFPTCLVSHEREQRKSSRVSGANRSDGGR